MHSHVVCCIIYLLIALRNVSIDANSVEHVEEASKTFHQTTKQTFVVIGALRVTDRSKTVLLLWIRTFCYLCFVFVCHYTIDAFF